MGIKKSDIIFATIFFLEISKIFTNGILYILARYINEIMVSLQNDLVEFTVPKRILIAILYLQAVNFKHDSICTL